MPERKSVPLRIHPRLYEALRRWAEDDFRSVNGQIEWLCHQALQQAGRLPKSAASDADATNKVDPTDEGSRSDARE